MVQYFPVQSRTPESRYGEDCCGFLALLGEGENFLALGRDTNIRNLEGKIQVNLVDV